jgi:heme/copper-type cytochrome/quinol oxidase subunit 3
MMQIGTERITMENKLMIRLVVGTEAMFFLCLIMAFVYFSFAPGFKHQQLNNLDIGSTGIFSVLLFFSSFTYWRAETNFRKGKIKQLKIWLLLTLALGFTFLFGQGREYLGLLNNHVSIASSSFGTSFFTLTGFHGLHVFVGLIIIAIITLLTFLGDYNDNTKSSVFSTVGIYWHFVDIVWLFVFIIVYIIQRLS